MPSGLPARILAIPLVLLDLLLVACAAVALAILLTGGGDYPIGRIHVEAWRARNPLIALFLLAAIRYLLRRAGPFLGIPRLSLGRLPAVAARASRALHAWLVSLTPRSAGRALAGLVFAAFLMRVANAFCYYGFFSGDDVEIHQMTFSALFGAHAELWDLRSPFYPMSFIYPVQWLALRLGVTDPLSLVLSGRVVVASFSCLSLWLVFRVAALHFGGLAAGMVAAFLLATSRLHVRFGSSELPGPVASVFLLIAFWAVISPRRSAFAASVAGVAIGLAACLRFSEAVYAFPLAAQLLIERRLRDLLLAGLTAVATAVVVLGVGDALYWGRAFHSLQSIVDFTLVRSASSRGFQPFYYYATQAPTWSNVFTLAFFLVALRLRQWKAALWVLLPVVVLSLLPHKEERYLVPALPFVALAAAQGFVHLLERVRRPGHEAAALLLMFALAGAVLFELEGARFRRSEAAVDLARYLAGEPGVRQVAIEQAWRAGSNLFLGRTKLWDLDAERMGEPGYVRSVLLRAELQYVALRDESVQKAELEPLLESAGFAAVPLAHQATRDRYHLFRRRGGS